jgi:5-methylcytosine-specific restriction endonuclease McrA
MSRYISSNLRDFIAKRAKNRCEYCLISDEFSYFSFHIEHIISLKHGGKSQKENLAYACPICNCNKGTDLGTFLDDSTKIIRFFNPRIDNWKDHFVLEKSGLIRSNTEIGAATIKIFDLNHIDSIIERKELYS